jgi:SAM-dependent methyltransferase/uncharacterized protein YbaR (Trm112 family)
MSLADWLVCPACRGSLRLGAREYRCQTCEASYPVTEGIAVFVSGDAADHDELGHLAGKTETDHWRHADDRAASHKSAQAAYFDSHELAEFEIERPNGSPALYNFLLKEKFQRGIAPLGRHLDGWTALAVCGGSGMDAEFLARAGATVISSDISLGAAKRSLERARRHALSILPIVADVERLPFRDRSIDLVYVHDGLHHLTDPSVGIDEMVRVARKAVSITEPAQSVATDIAVRVGFALAREESGNLVARLRAGDVAVRLERAGFVVARVERYAMYYRHHPGRVVRALSDRRLLPAVVAAWRLGNAIVGRRIGNKLSVTGVR